MKIFYSIFILFAFLFSELLAQSATNLNVRLQPLQGTTSDWEFDLQLIFETTPANGVTIEVPKELSLIPVSVSVNNVALWLQNNLSLPTQDSVVAWQRVNAGIMLIFKNGLFKTGDRLNLHCIAGLSNSKFEINKVNIREIIWQNNSVTVSKNIFASGSLPQIPSRR